MNTMTRVMLICFIACLPVSAFAADENTKCYQVNLTGTLLGETTLESNIAFLTGDWAEITTSKNDSVEPSTWIAFKIGQTDKSKELEDIIPLGLIDKVRSAKSGDCTVLYYLPDCDQLEIEWFEIDPARLKQNGNSSGGNVQSLVKPDNQSSPAGKLSVAITN